MHKFKLLSLCGLSFLLLFISSCASFTEYGKLEKSARENYQRGSYDQAVFNVVQSLKINPDYDKSQGLIKEVFPKAIDYRAGKIQEAKPSTEKYKWDTVVSEYEAMIKLNAAIKSLPALADKKTKEPIKFELADYSKELSEAKNNAAEVHYQEGVLLSKKGTSMREQAAKEFTSANKFIPGYKDALTLAAEGYYQEGLRLIKQEGVDIQKQAAKEFKTAMSYVPGYKDSAEFYEQARKSGIKRIAIIPFEDKSCKGGQYGAVAEEVVDGIVSQIMNDAATTEFLEIISRDQLQAVLAEQKLSMSGIVDDKSAVEAGKLLGVHEILTGQITNITVTPESTTNKVIKDKGRAIVRTEKVTDNKGKQQEKDIYGDVFADVTIYSRTAGASIAGSYKIVEVKTAKLKNTQSFKGNYDFKTEWGKFSGDERALSDSSKSLVSRDEGIAPVAEEMVNLAKKDLISSLASTIKSYAK